MKQSLDINLQAINYNKETRHFSVYLSDISLNNIDLQCHRHEPITLLNPSTKKLSVITWTHDDKDGSNEDIYGFNYKGTGIDGKPFKFLFIND